MHEQTDKPSGHYIVGAIGRIAALPCHAFAARSFTFVVVENGLEKPEKSIWRGA